MDLDCRQSHRKLAPLVIHPVCLVFGDQVLEAHHEGRQRVRWDLRGVHGTCVRCYCWEQPISVEDGKGGWCGREPRMTSYACERCGRKKLAHHTHRNFYRNRGRVASELIWSALKWHLKCWFEVTKWHLKCFRVRKILNEFRTQRCSSQRSQPTM